MGFVRILCLNQQRRRCYPFPTRGEMTNPDAIYYGKYCYNGE